MAVGTGRKAWVWALLAAGVGAGALARYPVGSGQAGGLVPVALFAVGLVVLGFPLLLAEAALGQLRRKGAGDAFTGAWRAAGIFTVLAALALASLVAMLAGWAARYAYASFQGDFFDDPARHFRVASQGWDALLLAFAVLLVAVGVGQARGAGAPADDPVAAPRARPGIAVAGTLALVAVLALGLWGLAQGSAPRRAALAFDLDSLDAALVVWGLQQALLPGMVGFGAVATWSSELQDRALAPAATQLVLLWAAVAVAATVGLAAFATDAAVDLDSGFAGAFTSAAALFAAIGGTMGGVLAGLFFLALLLGGIAATVALLDVPAAWLAARSDTWTPPRASAAAALVAYLLAIPLAFVASLAQDLHVILLAIVAPLGGLALSLHVGWVRPHALDGFTFGEANHPVAAVLRPALRYVLPVLLAALLALGVLQVLAETGALEHGSAGLWRLVP